MIPSAEDAVNTSPSAGRAPDSDEWGMGKDLRMKLETEVGVNEQARHSKGTGQRGQEAQRPGDEGAESGRRAEAGAEGWGAGGDELGCPQTRESLGRLAQSGVTIRVHVGAMPPVRKDRRKGPEAVRWAGSEAGPEQAVEET